MSVQFRPLVRWPEADTRNRRGPNTFSASWQNTLSLLASELTKLGAQQVVVQADMTEADIRLDGMPRSNATVGHPGVIVSFESKHGPLQYLTDTHVYWQHNVRGIALGLQSLRAVDRYGITKTGQQYTGWRQLTAGSGMTSREQAEALILRLTGEAAITKSVFKRALMVAHPDHGGDTDTLAAVRDAGRLLQVGSQP